MKKEAWGASVGILDRQKYPTITVIIPARNEAPNLRHVLPCIPEQVTEVILIDGHSTDNTIEEAYRLLPTIQVIQQTGHGKGDALRAGFAASTGEIIVMLDADGSADPREIPHFVDTLIQGYDFAKGSRFLKGGGSEDITFVRSCGNALLSLWVNLLFRTKFSDLCYGYNAFWRRCLEHVVIDCDGFEVETLLNLRMHQAKMKIAEIPSYEYQRIHGQSQLNTFRDGWRVLHTIMSERIGRNAIRLKEMSPTQLQVVRTFSWSLLKWYRRFEVSIDISIKKRVV